VDDATLEDKRAEIMMIASKLLWFQDNPDGYPLMQGSEVEKCILMALDDQELARFRNAAGCSVICEINHREAVNASWK